jgi:hypothetical protein
MTMTQIRGELKILNHGEAVRYFNNLIVDLLKKEAGMEHEPITKERLQEAQRHIQNIQACERAAWVRQL